MEIWVLDCVVGSVDLYHCFWCGMSSGASFKYRIMGKSRESEHCVLAEYTTQDEMARNYTALLKHIDNNPTKIFYMPRPSKDD